jgi:hypothetical protein
VTSVQEKNFKRIDEVQRMFLAVGLGADSKTLKCHPAGFFVDSALGPELGTVPESSKFPAG